MKLIALDIRGFKSFPESTHIQFHEGITAIVGPNGSGKSNIADALLWVLGEQSVKSLRGGKMQDLIFSGTEQRKSQAYAEVILTLDNSDHELNIEYETVEIKRRLYRTGESEYAINQKTCRLKDIVDLLLDSGLGKNGYSLVGQGRIDEILSARYEDRRAIFDEAAGISKYRKRKEEAEQKLRYTEDNLLRIQDIQREISTQLTTLSKQAELAQSYLQLNNELTALDLERIYYDLHTYNSTAATLQADIAILTQQIATEEQTKQTLLDSNNLLQSKKSELANLIENLHVENEKLNIKAAELKQQLELSHLNQSKFKQSYLEKETAINEFKSEIAAINTKEQTENANREQVNAEISRLSAELTKWQNEFGAILAENSQAENKWQAAQTALTTDQAAYWQEQAKLTDLQAKQSTIKSQIAVQTTNCTDLSTELKRLIKEFAQQESQVELAEIKEKEANNSYVEATNSYNELKSKLQKASQDLSAKEAAFNTLLYREHGLRQACENYEGFNQSVRQLLTYIRKQRLYSHEQVCGSLADIITIPTSYAHAIDSVLGQSIQNIVTDTAQTAAELIDLLKEKRFGRANFLPLDNLRVRPIDERDLTRLQKVPGFKGLASNLVSYDPKYKLAVDYRLARIVVADNLNTARELARLCDSRYLIVTLDGDQISIGGAMSGGERQRNSASLLLITRQQEIKQLANEIAEKSNLLKEQQVAYKNDMQQLGDFELAVTKQKQFWDACHVKTLTKKQVLEQLTLQKNNLERKLSDQQAQLATLEAEYNANYSNLPAALEAQKSAFSALQEREQKLQIEREALNKQSHSSADTQTKLHQCELALTEQKSALKLANELLFNLSEQKKNLQIKLSATKDILAVMITDQANLEKNEKQWQVDLAKVTAELEECKHKLQLKTASLAELENDNAGSFAKLNDIHALLSKLNSQLARLQNQQEREELKRRQLLQELWENYAKSLNDLPDKINANYQPKRDEAKIRNLRAEIKALGPVNVEAIEQFADLQQRYDFIEQQRSDIIAGKRELDQLIMQITSAMRSKFAESFALIRENFQAIFVKLFGGGQGEILIDETADILTANIEIKACPPGKRMQNMLLLSGGERCLTAIALLFAIQELKPSAFCVLDEVEAALDDANIFRFTEFLQKQAEKTQFIIVTHRKSTMAACERIYGVTMQERGVSQVLTLALESDKLKFSEMIE